MKICPVGAELFLADRHDEVKGHFHYFVKVPKNGKEQNLQHEYG